MQTKNFMSFSDFTNLYALSKTLRFELRPIGRTEEFFKKNKVFEKDKTINDSYNQAKLYFDEMHRRLIRDALNTQNTSALDYEKYAKHWKELQKDKGKYIQNWKDAQKEFRECISNLLDQQAEQWKSKYASVGLNKADIKQKGTDFLSSAGMVKILKKEFPKEAENQLVKEGFPSLFIQKAEAPEQKQYIFDSFDRFSTYLAKFNQTRDNLYKDDGTPTAIATRVVENFVAFLQNQAIFNNHYISLKSELDFSREEIDCFTANYYVRCLLQEDIDEYNKTIGQINARIKELRDRKQKESDFKKSGYPLLKSLNKQILGKIEKKRQFIENKADVFPAFSELIEQANARLTALRQLINNLCEEVFEEAYGGIYIKNTGINTISRRWFASWYDFEIALPQKSKNEEESKVVTFVSLQDIKDTLENKLSGDIFKEEYYKKKIINKEQSNWKQILAILQNEWNELFSEYQKALENTKKLDLNSVFSNSKEQVEIIKSFADASLRVYQVVKYFALEHKKSDEIPSSYSTDFYEEFDKQYNNFEFIPYYNALRNFLTKKVVGENKIKINFEKGNLLNGWAESPEGNAQFCGYILKKENKYFLGITDQPTILDTKDNPSLTNITDKEYYEKMAYRQLKSTTIYGSGYEGLYNSKYANDKKYISESKIIERVKKLLQEKYLTRFPELKQIIEKEYKDANELAKNLGNFNLYSLEFIPVNKNYIEKLTHDKNGSIKYLYIFEIANKDLGKITPRKYNIHSLYFKNLFSEDNLEKPVFKLSGGAEIFFRPKTVNLPKKKDKAGKDIIDHKRYAQDKLFFHLPIVINFGAGKVGKFNQELNKKLLAGNKNINIIGIDRGEKHLAYYSVINQKGEIIEQDSLNEINGVNYYGLLQKREKERLENRKSWLPLQQIKDLKRGYISQVVYKIVRLAIEHNAIIVLEDLNMRFKQIRGGIEKSIYQQLEKALIDKLGYLVFKDRNAKEVGGVLQGYQLSAPFESFQKIGKQTGIIFYTQASYTSVTDPLTGFRKNIYVSNSAPIEKIKVAINNFEEIGWDDVVQSYFFNYDTKNFSNGNDIQSKKWKIYAKVPRIKREKVNGYWQYNDVDPNDMLEKLFRLYEFKNLRSNMLEQIHAKETNGELRGERDFDNKPRNFYQSLVYILNLILQLRNSTSKQIKLNEKEDVYETGEDVDFIASPAYPFFTTLSSKSNSNLAGFENRFTGLNHDQEQKKFNGDANGAYNIARKGIIILERITKNSDKPNLYISNEDWDKFVSQSYP
jgi:hypothetical protein